MIKKFSKEEFKDFVECNKKHIDFVVCEDIRLTQRQKQCLELFRKYAYDLEVGSFLQIALKELCKNELIYLVKDAKDLNTVGCFGSIYKVLDYYDKLDKQVRNIKASE